MAATGDEPQDDKAKRVRSLLASYYTNDQGAAPSSSASDLPRSRSSGIDSSGFDADKSYARLLSQTRLDELLKKEVNLDAEVRTLDGDMQMLVYENYNKFISATDTIRSMRSEVDDMESKMRGLKQSVHVIAQSNEQIDGKLEIRRNKFDELSTVRGVMRKLQLVFGLPAKIELAIQSDALEVAVKYVAAGRPFLANFTKGTPAGARAQVEALAGKLVVELRRRLDDKDQDAVEVIGLLRQLDEPVAELKKYFLSSARGALHRAVDEALEPLRAPAAEKGGGEPDPLQAALLAVESGYVPKAAKLAHQFKEIFPTGEGEDDEPGLDQVVVSNIAQVVQAARLHLACSPDGPSLPTPDKFASRLAALWRSLQGICADLAVEDGGDSALECIEFAARSYVGVRLLKLEGSLQREVRRAAESATSSPLGAPGEEGARELQGVYTAACEAVGGLAQAWLADMQTLLVDLGPLVRHWSDALFGLVEEGVYQVLGEVVSKCAEEGPGANGVPVAVLVTSQVLNFVAREVIPSVSEQLASGFVTELDSSAVQVLTSKFERCASACRDRSSSLLERFVSMEGRVVSRIVRSRMLSEVEQGGPGETASGPYPVFEEICAALRTVEGPVCQLVSDPGSRGAVAKGHSRAKSSQDVSMVERNVDRLFREKIVIFGSVERTQSAVLCGIAKIGLKSMVETIRLATLKQGGCAARIQVSIAHFTDQVGEMFGEDKTLEFLYDEIVTAVMDRSKS